MKSTVFVVDARTRVLNCFMVSATQVKGEDGGIILRKAMELGNISDYVGKKIDYPILVAGSYAAMSSCGFTKQIGPALHEVWIGGLGFGFGQGQEKGKALRPFGQPVEVSYLPAGTTISAIETHSSSNPQTAEAALVALELRAWAKNEFYLAAGQSDWTTAYYFGTSGSAEGEIEFPQEHRTDIFSPENILNAIMRRLVRENKGRLALNYAIMQAAGQDGRSLMFLKGMPQEVIKIFGLQEVKEIVEKKYNEYIEAGWKFGLDISGYHKSPIAVSPEGDITRDYVFEEKEIEALFLELATVNTGIAGSGE